MSAHGGGVRFGQAMSCLKLEEEIRVRKDVARVKILDEEVPKE